MLAERVRREAPAHDLPGERASAMASSGSAGRSSMSKYSGLTELSFFHFPFHFFLDDSPFICYYVFRLAAAGVFRLRHSVFLGLDPVRPLGDPVEILG